MTAFTYRMGAGSPGDVTRLHPASIRAFVNNPSGGKPIVNFGWAAIFDNNGGTANTIKTLAAATGGGTTTLAGVSVRPFPTQDSGYGETYGAAAYGSGGPVAGGVVDLLCQGSILVTLSAGLSGTYAAGTYAILGAPLYVRVAAGTGPWSLAPVGGFEIVPDAGTSINQTTVANAYLNGPADQFGVAEITLID